MAKEKSVVEKIEDVASDLAKKVSDVLDDISADEEPLVFEKPAETKPETEPKKK